MRMAKSEFCNKKKIVIMNAQKPKFGLPFFWQIYFDLSLSLIFFLFFWFAFLLCKQFCRPLDCLSFTWNCYWLTF